MPDENLSFQTEKKHILESLEQFKCDFSKISKKMDEIHERNVFSKIIEIFRTAMFYFKLMRSPEVLINLCEFCVCRTIVNLVRMHGKRAK